MRRCQVFNISAGVSVPSFAIKPGMSFYAGLRERGEHTLEHVFWGVFRSLLWHVPFTVNPPLFLHPLRVNGMGGVSLAPHDPRHCAENGRCAVCSTPASSGGPGGLDILVSTALWPPSWRPVLDARLRSRQFS